MDLLRITCVRLLKDKSEENITHKYFITETVRRGVELME